MDKAENFLAGAKGATCKKGRKSLGAEGWLAPLGSMKLLSSKWMLAVAAAWLLAAILALVKEEMLFAGFCALLSVWVMGSYRRDRRRLGS
jgi:hypothetical protein